MGVLTQLSASPLCSLLIFHPVTIHDEGVYITFPSCALKLSNLHIQVYLLALTTLNAFYLLRTRENCSRSVYIIQVCFIKLPHLCSRINSKRNSKFVLACPAVLRFRTGSLDVGDAPASFLQCPLTLQSEEKKCFMIPADSSNAPTPSSAMLSLKCHS
jgi:hypothetical protein